MRGRWCRACLFFFQAEDGIRDWSVTGVQTCALPIYAVHPRFAGWRIRGADRNLDLVVPQAVESPANLAPIGGGRHTCVPRREVPPVTGAHVQAERAGTEGACGGQPIGFGAKTNPVAPVRADADIPRPDGFHSRTAVRDRNFGLDACFP